MEKFCISRDVPGNPKMDDFVDDNSRILFGHQLILILDELYELLLQINLMQVLHLEDEVKEYLKRRFLEENSMRVFFL
nr:hypothetical protein CFP56_60313 [Quercus suber]